MSLRPPQDLSLRAKRSNLQGTTAVNGGDCFVAPLLAMTPLNACRVDCIVEEVLVEIKAKAALEDVDFVQTLSYLKASGHKVALLLNFGAKRLEVKRIVYEKGRR